jgi:membrane protease YdiL (CAAX protease family)
LLAPCFHADNRLNFAAAFDRNAFHKGRDLMRDPLLRRWSVSTIAAWPTWQLVVTGAFASLAGQVLIGALMERIFGDPAHLANLFDGHPKWLELFITVVLAPLYETLIFQWAIMTLLHRLLRRSWLFAGIVSTVIFGLCHGYTDWRAISLITTSATLAAVFAIEARRGGSPVVATASTHALFNGLVMCVHSF